ncbi:MAG: DegT/DnrJ/EryC1/StrS family aminotransferase [Planctomycetes bacterium]|nr:DegT/DnrJ/EryC1/StrS family aminotransferase [Planctomycetota bacterium]
MTDLRAPLSLPSDRDATGRDLGDAELALLREVIESGHLNSTGGTLTPRFEREFATRFGAAHAIACASGSAAIHAALGSLRLEPGDEVVTTPITDMGAILPIGYEGAVPVFAAVETTTGNVTADTIEACLTDRTRAVIVTHLFGRPCDLPPILELVRGRDIVLIEDCAQAFLAEFDGSLVGSFGDMACYSFQQGKHMTTGEGGIVTTNKGEVADRITRFVNKGWGYGDPNPDHDCRGLNYRLTELQAAVGIAQLQKLDRVVEHRQQRARQMCDELRDLGGIRLPDEGLGPNDRHAFWRFAVGVDPEVVPGGPDALGRRLTACGVHNAPRYIKKPAFDCAVLREGPFATDVDHGAHTSTRACLERLLVLPWNEHYTPEHVSAIADEIRRAHEELAP